MDTEGSATCGLAPSTCLANLYCFYDSVRKSPFTHDFENALDPVQMTQKRLCYDAFSVTSVVLCFSFLASLVKCCIHVTVSETSSPLHHTDTDLRLDVKQVRQVHTNGLHIQFE